MNRAIVKIIFFLLAFLPMPNAFSQEGEGNPYACFGDESPVRDIARQTEVSETRVFIVLSDTVRAEIHIEDDRLTVIDTGGKERSMYKIDLSSRALFSAPDPKANEMPWVSPYVYCFGNPIHFIDETGERPSAYEAAMMASAVYKDENYNNRIEELARMNWQISAAGSDMMKNHPAGTGIGIQSMVFERTNDEVTEYAYVFAGTNSWEDAFEDITQVLGISPQHARAIENAKSLSSEVGSNELTFIGHSFGGSLAAASGMATGRSAITFNPAVLSKSTQLVYGLSGNSENIVNYISSTPSILGVKISVDYITNIQDQFFLQAPGRNELVPVCLYPNHSINDLTNALSPK